MNIPTSSPARAGFTLVLLLLAAAGCGTLTMGGLAEAEVTVSGDAPDPGTAAANVPGLPPVGRQEEEDDDDDDDDDEAEGQLEADFFLYLVDEAGEAVSLSQDQVEVRLDLQGVQEANTGLTSVPARRYTALRAVFTDIEVEVDAGLIIGGDTITGAVDVDQEADSIPVERVLSLDLMDGDRVELLLDLNAQTWLTQVDPTVQTVAQDFFTSAIEVRVLRR